MGATREQVTHRLLLDALGHPVDLNTVDWHVRQQNPSATPSDVQNETLEFIRSLVNDGLFRMGHEAIVRNHPGSTATEGQRFVAWHHPLEHSIRHISHDYLKHYDDPEQWIYSAYLALTDQGEQLARSLEQKGIDSYRRFE